MNMAIYLSALTLGFLGSFHCAGMCGPLVFMLPKNSESPAAIFKGRFIYNFGRVITYITIGLLFGLFGLAVAMKGFQRELSVFSGVLIAVGVLLTSRKKERLKAHNITLAYTTPLRKQLKKLFVMKSYFALFLMGVLNGLLPCGFVYLAVAGAASTGSVTGGALYMALFGLGTFPMMMFISVAANYLGVRFKKIFSAFSPVIAIALALFLIYRGTDMKTSDCHQEKNVFHMTCAVPNIHVSNNLFSQGLTFDSKTWHSFFGINCMLEKTKLTRMQFSIWFSFVYLTVYVASIMLNASETFVFLLFAGSPFIIIWVVISILKDKHEPKKTFHDYFYQDEHVSHK